MKKTGIKILILLHILLAVYSVTGIVSKLAAGCGFLSFKWCVLYGMEILLLGLYAVGWQQIIKRMPLTSAFANKAVTTVWGLIWGMLFFGEKITVGKIVGVVLVMAGVILYAMSDNENEDTLDAEEYSKMTDIQEERM